MLPTSDPHTTTTRVSSDSTICQRGRVFVDHWALWDVTPLNGSFADTSGSPTCIRHNGSSVVDYICVRGNALHFEVVTGLFDGLSDHAPILCRVEGP